MLQLHGSGKTAVLVERIINKVINDNIDIDKILIVTFTSAAASEMRERILEAIYKKLEENPANANLQKQIILLNKSNISTIHSFCLDVIRNNFFEIDTSANFRVADTAEIELLKQEIIDDLFEEKYIKDDCNFNKLLDIYTNYRGDENLRQLILNVYKFIQSSPFPEQWLKEKVEMFNLKNKLDNDFSETVWGEILLNNFKEELTDSILKLKQVENNLSKYDELVKYKLIIGEDIKMLENLEANSDKWELAYNISNNLLWGKWPSDRKITIDYKNEAKEIRDSIKKKVALIIDKYLVYTSKQANSDIFEMHDVLNYIKDLVIEFSKKFATKKKEKNIVDFNDIEHFALSILLRIDENGRIYETDVAKKYKEKFEEIAIDEYQDSNLVQEFILKSVSKGNNIFMVGDVKQSIYKFRQARPELFLEKYDLYKLKNERFNSEEKCSVNNSNNINANIGEIVNESICKNIEKNINENSCNNKGLKIQLFKNFRSRENVLDITNLIFKNIMSKNLGDINYNENEYLNYGANFPNNELNDVSEINNLAELHILDLKQPEEDIYVSPESTEEESEVQLQERVEDVVLEAKYVAKKIKELIDSNYMVFDRKKGYRKITYKDIVVLLRSTKVPAPIFEKEISNLNMPVFSDVSLEYLESIEIQTIISLLKIIDNPMQDIPLVSVLRSSIGGFTDNELVEIRGKEKNKSFYESLVKYYENCCIDEKICLKNKIEKFLNLLKKWQDEEKYMALDELIWQIYSDTNFYNYVTLLPNGGLRQANLKILFERAKQYESASFKGLFNFINFIDKLHSTSGDLSSAKLIGENENVIRIMSIHKSKGLEFPVVFLACTGKQFNLQDLNDNIILHQDLGFGPKYINNEKKIEYSTLAKEAIRIKSKVETLSEEMRVLYVALTRAKEKLIITGISKDAEKSIKEKELLLNMYNSNNQQNNNNINYVILKKYKSYLDWIELVYLNNKKDINNYMSMNIIRKDEFIHEINNTKYINNDNNLVKKLDEKATRINKEKISKLSNILNWKYLYMDSSCIPTKTSVTKLKEEVNFNNDANYIESSFAISRPQFLNEEITISNAQKGTLMHMCFQNLDETKVYTKQMLESMIQDFIERKIITPLEGKAINIHKLYSYTKSDLFNKLKNAKAVYKEQPFYINVKADEIYKNGLKDNILVQGIIDLFFIDENNEIVLVDYKTDFVENGKEHELVNKYKKQLELYKRALQYSYNKQVSKTYIYSVYLEKLIEVI